jgi:hypothetical protein
MIELIQDYIWNIGGFLLSISLIFLALAWIYSTIINRLMGWHNKEERTIIYYWITHHKEIKKYIEDKKKVE